MSDDLSNTPPTHTNLRLATHLAGGRRLQRSRPWANRVIDIIVEGDLGRVA